MLHSVLIGMALAAGFVLFGLLLAGLAALLAICVRLVAFFVDLLGSAPRALKSFTTLLKEPYSTNPPRPVEPAAHRIPLALLLFVIVFAVPIVALFTQQKPS
jgi:hypothetical protein